MLQQVQAQHSSFQGAYAQRRRSNRLPSLPTFTEMAASQYGSLCDDEVLIESANSQDTKSDASRPITSYGFGVIHPSVWLSGPKALLLSIHSNGIFHSAMGTHTARIAADTQFAERKEPFIAPECASTLCRGWRTWLAGLVDCTS